MNLTDVMLGAGVAWWLFKKHPEANSAVDAALDTAAGATLVGPDTSNVACPPGYARTSDGQCLAVTGQPEPMLRVDPTLQGYGDVPFFLFNPLGDVLPAVMDSDALLQSYYRQNEQQYLSTGVRQSNYNTGLKGQYYDPTTGSSSGAVAARSNGAAGGLFTPGNLVLVGGLGILAFALLKRRKKTS